MRDFIKKHPWPFQCVLAVLAGIVGCWGYWLITSVKNDTFGIGSVEPYALFFPTCVMGSILGMFIVYPLLITVYELYQLFTLRKPGAKKVRMAYHLHVIALAVCYDLLYLALIKNVDFAADWQEQLYNAARHTPVFTGSYLTIWMIVLVAFAGLAALGLYPVKKLPPLVTVLSLSAMYLGVILSIVWTAQIFVYEDILDFLLLLLPVNALAIMVQVMVTKIGEYEPDPNRSSKIDGIPLLGWYNRTLQNAKLWPVAAFLLMWPLLGILIACLLLFGQAPDSIIRAWTETSEFSLSQKISPQNLHYDEHYLCTAAAGGHRKVVKPQRMGVRHGHKVIVNRQLCVANAFEQVLEERTPKFHRAVRNIYDRYGFPVAKLIRSSYAADLVYILMKPLEWFFVFVLYLTDVHPEDRIAMQYTGKTLREIRFRNR